MGRSISSDSFGLQFSSPKPLGLFWFESRVKPPSRDFTCNLNRIFPGTNNSPVDIVRSSHDIVRTFDVYFEYISIRNGFNDIRRIILTVVCVSSLLVWNETF
jgi:hypothetical protein